MKKANDDARKAAENAKKLKKESDNAKANEKKDIKSEKVEEKVDDSGFGHEAAAVINALKKKVDHMERMFKKKEEVLMNQMHALKDEGFIRNQLERDALLLHKVDLRYRVFGTQFGIEILILARRAVVLLKLNVFGLNVIL